MSSQNRNNTQRNHYDAVVQLQAQRLPRLIIDDDSSDGGFGPPNNQVEVSFQTQNVQVVWPLSIPYAQAQ